MCVSSLLWTGIKYQRKGNNSVILKDKNLKNSHNLHMTTTNLNTHLWIRIYNGFAIIPDLRQTGIAKKPGQFWEKMSCEFFSVPCSFICKNNLIPTFFGFSIIDLQIYREILRNMDKGTL